MATLGDRTVEQVVDQLLEKERYISSTRRMPGENATPEEITDTLRKIHKVSSKEDYRMGEEVPDTVKPILQRLQELSYDTGTPPTAFSKIGEVLTEAQKAREQARQDAIAEKAEADKDALGDKYESMTEAAKAALEALYTDHPELKDRFSLEDPDQLRLLGTFGSRLMSDNTLPTGEGIQSLSGDEQLFEECVKIMESEEFSSRSNEAQTKRARAAAIRRYDGLMKRICDAGKDAEFERYVAARPR